MNKPERFPVQLSVQAGQQKKITPGVAQRKVGPTVQARHPVAPAVYRPQPTPKVLQRKTVGSQQAPHTQSAKPVAPPPVYRPQAVPKCLQTKMAPVAPAVKSSPVYRPQPVPKVLQPKPQSPSATVAPRLHQPAPKSLVQPKTIMPSRKPPGILQASLSGQKNSIQPKTAETARPQAPKPHQPKYAPQARSMVLQLATTAELITQTLNTDEIAGEAARLGIDADNYRAMLIELETQELSNSLSDVQGYVGVGWFRNPLEPASCYPQSIRLLNLLRTNDAQLAADSARGSEGRDALVRVVGTLTAHIRRQHRAGQPTIYRVACGEHGFALIVRDGMVEHLESFASERTLRESATNNYHYSVDNVCNNLTNLVSANINTRRAAARRMGWNGDALGLGAGFPGNLGDKGFNWECSLMGDEHDIQQRVEARIAANRRLVTRQYGRANTALERRRAQEERMLAEMAAALLRERRRGRGNARAARPVRADEALRIQVNDRRRPRGGRGVRGRARGRGRGRGRGSELWLRKSETKVGSSQYHLAVAGGCAAFKQVRGSTQHIRSIDLTR
ncbi:MAG TPA: hypothetical protein VF290_19205 [Pyrinomonadaceae bacterium]